MKIYTYAVLKDYFDKEFTVDETVSNIESLNSILAERNPAAKDILAACRFAVKDNFVTNDFELQPGDQIHIIPPSSGG
jgi:molybdopterin converting factor small subunit